MAGLRSSLKMARAVLNSPCLITRRLLNYTSVFYEGKNDPASIFFDNRVQDLLKSLTRVDYEKVFRRRKLGEPHLSDFEYKFMTDEELQESLKEAERKADEILQIPLAIKVRDNTQKVLSKDPYLQGLESARIVFTDITYGIKDSDRLIVVREPDGTLQEAEWNLRQRMNQVYFPIKGRLLKTPRMFSGDYLQSLLERHEYEFVLNRACIQFEPDDSEYQRVTSIVYQHVNDNNQFDILRSTRHFGALTFFLVWNKLVDNLLIDLIETLKIEEAVKLVSLYSLVHRTEFNGTSSVEIIEGFIKNAGNKKAALELAVQAYKDVTNQSS